MWTLRTDAGDLDVLANIPGAGGTRLDYEALVERAGLVHVDNLSMLVASLDDVIVSKQVADRPKDHEALPELLQIAERSAPRMGGLVE
jgi:predicted nucleotidyltransferase